MAHSASSMPAGSSRSSHVGRSRRSVVRRGGLATVLGLLALGACTSSTADLDRPSPVARGDAEIRTETDGQARSAEDAPRMVVKNENTADVRVFLIQDGAPRRLGTVGSFDQRTFELPPAIAGPSVDAAVRIAPLAKRRRFTSRELLVPKAATVVVEVGPTVDQTYVSVLTDRR